MLSIPLNPHTKSQDWVFTPEYIYHLITIDEFNKTQHRYVDRAFVVFYRDQTNPSGACILRRLRLQRLRSISSHRSRPSWPLLWAPQDWPQREVHASSIEAEKACSPFGCMDDDHHQESIKSLQDQASQERIRSHLALWIHLNLSNLCS